LGLTEKALFRPPVFLMSPSITFKRS